MLLEAAEQALREANYLDREFDRKNTAVVVGAVFGGDFGNALYAGLRLPEFRDNLQSALMAQGLSEVECRSILDDFENDFLTLFPALLDETGSFTSSTLASRLSKTFDLMGGAMAIDSGEVSSMAALDAAVNLLRSNAVTHVLCATAQRSMDRAAFERFLLQSPHRLKSTNREVGVTDLHAPPKGSGCSCSNGFRMLSEITIRLSLVFTMCTPTGVSWPARRCFIHCRLIHRLRKSFSGT